MKDQSFWGESLHFKHLARFGGKSHGRPRLLEKLNNNNNNNDNNKAESFFRVNFDVFINVDTTQKLEREKSWDQFSWKKNRKIF